MEPITFIDNNAILLQKNTIEPCVNKCLLNIISNFFHVVYGPSSL